MFITVKMALTRSGPLVEEDRSSSASSFQASLLQVINGVMSLALCPQDLKLLNTSDLARRKPLVMVALQSYIQTFYEFKNVKQSIHNI